MRIDFKIIVLNDKEESIIDDFLEYVVKNMRSDILAESIPSKLYMLEEDLLNAEWMIWKVKPLRIDMMELLKLIVSKIGILKRRNHSYSICINPTAVYPGSATRLDTIARFIDKGTETCPSTCTFSKVMKRYRDVEIENAWDEYVKYRLNQNRVSKVVFTR